MKHLAAPEAWRQSHIATFDACPLQLRFTLESEQRHGSDVAARGTLFHRFAAAAIEHMRAHGNRTIDVDVALELLTEVQAQRDVPDEEYVHVSLDELRWLRVLVTKWAYGNEFNIDRVVDVERRLSADIEVYGPNGQRYTRTITGQPDLLLAGPAEDEATVLDWKSGWAPPPRKYEPEPGEPPKEDRLSDMGIVQQVVYGWLVMKNYPAIERVTEREIYVMSDGAVREATVWRYEMERIEDRLAARVAHMDAAVEAGSRSARWIPVAGTHCGYCPRPHDCPIKDELGIPATLEDAQRMVQGWHVAGVVRSNYSPLLKGWVDAHGPIPVAHSKGRMMLGWVPNKSGDGRSFKLYQPEDAPAPLEDGVLVDA